VSLRNGFFAPGQKIDEEVEVGALTSSDEQLDQGSMPGMTVFITIAPEIRGA
jgi:hypothetical protein